MRPYHLKTHDICRQLLYCCIIFVDFVGKFWVLRTVALPFLLFLVLKLYYRSHATSLVICNLCYEGSLVATSCNSLLLMKNELYFLEKRYMIQ
jgi:hypothetical protein